MKKLKSLALLAMLGLCSLTHADVYEASFEGGWYNASQSGRGIKVDYFPQDAGNGTYVISSFTYDNQGNPTWLQFLASGREGQRLFKNVVVNRVTGGTAGNTFPPLASLSVVPVGTATLDVASCTKMTLNFVPNATTTIPPISQVLERLDNAAGSPFCPFQQEFTACPTGTTLVPVSATQPIERMCEIPGGTVVGDLRLNNSANYRLGGRVAVGGALNADGSLPTNTGRLFIEPGTIIRGGEAASSRLIINPGSKIFAEGTPVAPIVFTGLTEVANGTAAVGTWAGLVIGGRAPINNGCSGSVGGTCAFEADTAVIWGGSIPTDSSGILKYVQIRSAGGVITGNLDLNSLTLGAVGSGTVIEYVQAYRGTDDAFEMFGGTVNLKHIVALGCNDDNIDTDNGYVGKIQYAYVKIQPNLSFTTNDSHGIEADNAGTSFDAIPRSRPQLINATIDGGGIGFDGIRIRRGSQFLLQNVVVTGFGSATAGSTFANGACLNLNDTATYTAATTPAGGLTIAGLTCATNKAFDNDAGAAFTVESLFTAALENTALANATGLFKANGRTPADASPLRSTNQAGADAFFDRSPVKGAFVDGDWTKGWTIGL
jgi:hypothetical protein